MNLPLALYTSRRQIKAHPSPEERCICISCGSTSIDLQIYEWCPNHTKSVVSFRSKFGAMALCTVLWCMIEVMIIRRTDKVHTCVHLCVLACPRTSTDDSLYDLHIFLLLHTSENLSPRCRPHKAFRCTGQITPWAKPIGRVWITNPFRIVFAHGHRMPISRSSKGSIHKDSSRNTCKEMFF